jgi:hypothetical protein
MKFLQSGNFEDSTAEASEWIGGVGEGRLTTDVGWRRSRSAAASIA